MSTTSKLISRISYPDPFKPSGVEFELSSPAEVTLTIFDHSGHEVATLLQNQTLNSGTHTIDFSNIKLTESFYFYRLSVMIGGETFVDTKKIVLTGTSVED